jgi:hypothetical protein
LVPFVSPLLWRPHGPNHGNPGLKFHGFDDLRIFHGVQLDDRAPATLRFLSGRAGRRDGLYVVPVEIRGERKGREVTHSRADIVLADRLPDAPGATTPPDFGPPGYTVDEMYDDILFHGPDLHGIERVDGLGAEGAVAFARVAPPPATWMEHPVRASWLADPLALDAVFQLLCVWSFQKHRAVSLPCFAGGYRQYRRAFPADGVLIADRLTRDPGATARADVELMDSDGQLVATLTDAEHVIDPSLNDAFRRGRLATLAGSGARLRIGGGSR